MRIGIIGFGRFGQLLAKILKKSHKIKVSDKINKSRAAKKIGVRFCDLNEVCQQDFIILAVPISEFKNVVLDITDKLKKGQIVIDTCSVKEHPAELMLKHLPKNIEILASHPMFGPDSAKFGLKGLQMVFCPIRIKRESLNKAKKIFRSFGLEIVEMTPKEHDQQSVSSLNLVHFIGRVLEKMEIRPPKITTLGFKQLLKACKTVTNDTWQLFCDMQNYNRFSKLTRKKFLKIALKIDKQLSTLTNDKQLSTLTNNKKRRNK